MAKRNGNTKSKIVTAAWDLFYRQGYDDTTIDEIVELSGTSKGSFYHYFESKDAILGSLAYLFDEKYQELENVANSEEDAFDTLIFLNQQLFDVIDNKIDPALVSRLYSTQLSMKGEKSLLDNSRIYYKLLRIVISRGQEKGELNTDMTVNDMVRYYAMCERALINEWCLCDWNFSLKNYSGQMLPMMLMGLRGNK